MELLKRLILTALARRDYTPQPPRQLAESLGLPPEDYPAFKKTLENLRQKGQIAFDSKKNVTLPPMGNRVIGTFRANARGFGFIVPLEPNAYGDLYVAPSDSDGAMSNDIVLARVVKKGMHGGQRRYAGVIIDIIERGGSRFVGTLRRNGDTWYVEPEGKGVFRPILVEDAASSGAREHDKVVLEIVSYPRGNEPAAGAIVEVIGKAGHYDSELRSIIAQYDLPTAFPQACLEQARQASQSFDPDAAVNRADLTDELIITIDPPDAKDFDDAISLRKDRDGNWRLGVHIADVSHFIPMNSPLDIEAKKRGNSVYLPLKVLPMLPEVLSNGICSLQPQQKRFTKTVYIVYDEEGNVLGTEFDNSVIRSSARLTYQEADKILKGHAAGFPGEVVALLKDMETLARAIERRRQKNGMLHLDLPETELVFDQAGRVVDAVPADTSYPHTIIEMFMVEANEAVAGLLDRFGVPFMRRIHPAPDAFTTKNLARFVKLCGLKVPRHLDRTAIQDLLEAVRGTSAEYAVNMHVLRSMQRAEYSPLHIGHFALASTHYCHFTSPIRRYADLTVHRLLNCYIEGRLNKIGLEEVLPESELIEIGKHITFTEQRAEDAENELKTVLILQMLSKRIGEELQCVVSGLTNFGVFVQCTKFGIEGLIEPGDLGMDEWKYDQRAQAVVGRWSGQSVHLGQPMKVRIAAVNVPSRQLFLTPSEPLVTSRPGRLRFKNDRKPKTRRKKAK